MGSRGRAFENILFPRSVEDRRTGTAFQPSQMCHRPGAMLQRIKNHLIGAVNLTAALQYFWIGLQCRQRGWRSGGERNLVQAEA